jgi:hypothetical protein
MAAELVFKYGSHEKVMAAWRSGTEGSGRGGTDCSGQNWNIGSIVPVLFRMAVPGKNPCNYYLFPLIGTKEHKREQKKESREKT